LNIFSIILCGNWGEKSIVLVVSMMSSYFLSNYLKIFWTYYYYITNLHNIQYTGKWKKSSTLFTGGHCMERCPHRFVVPFPCGRTQGPPLLYSKSHTFQRFCNCIFGH
jgi:hypothetical protein